MSFTSMVLFAFALAVLVAVAAVFLLALREARALQVERDTLHISDLPESLVGTTIAFLADIHAGPIYGVRRMERLVDRVNSLAPDVIVLGGDYVGGQRNGADIFYPAAAHFSAKHGVYAVLGNHDAWEGGDEARRRMAQAGIRLLENDAARIEIGDGALAIVGLADEWTGVPDIAAATAQMRPGDVGVLVAHNPDSFADALPRSTRGWAIALAGHTHGRQVVGVYQLNPHKPTRYGKRYLRHGLAEEDGVPVLVSNGVGAVTLPVRFFARPELHLITLDR